MSERGRMEKGRAGLSRRYFLFFVSYSSLGFMLLAGTTYFKPLWRFVVGRTCTITISKLGIYADVGIRELGTVGSFAGFGVAFQVGVEDLRGRTIGADLPVDEGTSLSRSWNAVYLIVYGTSYGYTTSETFRCQASLGARAWARLKHKPETRQSGEESSGGLGSRKRCDAISRVQEKGTLDLHGPWGRGTYCHRLELGLASLWDYGCCIAAGPLFTAQMVIGSTGPTAKLLETGWTPPNHRQLLDVDVARVVASCPVLRLTTLGPHSLSPPSHTWLNTDGYLLSDIHTYGVRNYLTHKLKRNEVCLSSIPDAFA
ncbi:hypothetical protein BDP55DRAFT_626909 [Colletotrichum godetiae]|uniref:Uncharacterized protein n=1 Tax=Colletotrichum godetiae TaxID=1209918 RepID=A0AAJ0F106_9PEZI|nr:uncharacterized protein BDP55DRAFT_626909 [Colletotrichum godetiae]KAK1691226.1 hypothetical protein BDP55DRAFT_626909 [Colletotrichum godetiae]